MFPVTAVGDATAFQSAVLGIAKGASVNGTLLSIMPEMLVDICSVAAATDSACVAISWLCVWIVVFPLVVPAPPVQVSVAPWWRARSATSWG